MRGGLLRRDGRGGSIGGEASSGAAMGGGSRQESSGMPIRRACGWFRTRRDEWRMKGRVAPAAARARNCLAPMMEGRAGAPG